MKARKSIYHNKWVLLLLLILFSSIQVVQAQRAKERSLNNKAELLFVKEQFSSAMPYYKQLIQIDPENDIYNFALGLCYLNSLNEQYLAIPYFEYLVEKHLHGVFAANSAFQREQDPREPVPSSPEPGLALVELAIALHGVVARWFSGHRGSPFPAHRQCAQVPECFRFDLAGP